jgi:hypothetical protein
MELVMLMLVLIQMVRYIGVGLLVYKMTKKIILMIVCILICINSVFAVDYGAGTNITSEGLNTTINIITGLTVNSVNISDTFIILENFTYDSITYGNLKIIGKNAIYTDAELPFLFNNPILIYNFNENTGSTAYDTSNNDLNGIIGGSTWNNDGVKVALTSAVDYTLDTINGVFRLINSAYDKAYIMFSYTHFNPEADTTGGYNSSRYVKEAGSQVGSNLSLIAIISVFAIIIGLLTTFFISKVLK